MALATDSRTTQTLVDALDARGFSHGDLAPVVVRPSLTEYIGQLWDRRHFIWMDARHRVATQNSRNRLGSLWLVLRPLLDALMFYIFFALILKTDRGMENFAAFIIIGVLMFRGTMGAFSRGSTMLRGNKSMIRAFSFPRAARPISAEIRDALQMGYVLATVIVMIMAVPNHERPEWTWFLVPIIYVLQFLLNLGITLTLSRIGFLFPDTSQFMGFVGRFMMYASGVIFPIERFLDNAVFMFFIQINPVYHMLEMYREVLMDGTIPAAEHWMVLGAWAVGLTLFGFIFFWRGEATYGDGE
ncbi:ABC transporter permease [Brachybacterium tyrofermentans]|uniref:ABC transporter permease n=1 Tax=Brachybacterium tyrofermentans TaxID=47848 RepID=UPI003FD56706